MPDGAHPLPPAGKAARPGVTPTAARVGPRPMGPVNWIGLWTLYGKEVRRFLKVFTQTVAAPVVTTLLFYTIFALALGGAVRTVGDTPFLVFLAPGLMMMTMAQNAFANTSSSVMVAKVQGNIVDILMPPLASWELALAIVGGGLTRGLLVGLAAWTAIVIFIPLGAAAPHLVLFHAIAASMSLSLLGVIGGIWAQKFDHIAAVTNFVVTPLAFLSGTFYSIERLPEAWQIVAHLNPFFYMIDGFRYGFIGVADSNLIAGVVVMTALNLFLWAVVLRMLNTGYRLKP